MTRVKGKMSSTVRRHLLVPKAPEPSQVMPTCPTDRAATKTSLMLLTNGIGCMSFKLL